MRAAHVVRLAAPAERWTCKSFVDTMFLLDSRSIFGLSTSRMSCFARYDTLWNRSRFAINISRTGFVSTYENHIRRSSARPPAARQMERKMEDRERALRTEARAGGAVRRRVATFAFAAGLGAVAAISTPPGVLAQNPRPGPRDSAWRSEGQTIWIAGPDGQLKVRAYPSARISEHPVLVLWIHGDLDPWAEHYELARQMAHVTENVVTAALLRPGYSDADGDWSAGFKGYAMGDNYTADVVDDVHAVIGALKDRFHPRAVVVMGHSGGAGITAGLLGRHPDDADAAVLIACSCDPTGLMARLTAANPRTPKGIPNPSLVPLELASRVSKRVHVRMVTGSKDMVVLLGPSQAYAQALKAQGIDVQLTVAPGAGHGDVLGTAEALQAVGEAIRLEGGEVSATGR